MRLAEQRALSQSKKGMKGGTFQPKMDLFSHLLLSSILGAAQTYTDKAALLHLTQSSDSQLTSWIFMMLEKRTLSSKKLFNLLKT